MRTGWVRLLGVTGCLAVICILSFKIKEEVPVFLYWVEWLSVQPGLSGAIILFLAIVIFFVGCFVVKWVSSGFKKPAE
tara:strand:+ start:4084 stop:4317 length:234 start_codon:yes stop_codon:yes gene_type:complete